MATGIDPRGLLLLFAMAAAAAACDGSPGPQGLDPGETHGQASGESALEAALAFGRSAQPALRAQVEAAVDLARHGTAERRVELGRLLEAHRAFAPAGAIYATVPQEAVSARLRFHQARTHYELGRSEEALERLGQAIELDAARAALRWRRGLWLADLGRFEQAEGDFRRAVELDPDDPSGAIGLARLLLDDGRPAEALAVLEALLERQPLLHAAHLADRARAALGQPPQLPEGLVVAPHFWSDPWLDELEELRVGQGEELDAVLAAVQAGEVEVALTALDRLLGEDPDNVTIQGLIAAAQARAGRPEAALDLLRAASERQPRHYRIALNLSINLLAAGRTQEALVEARRAVALHAGHAGARFQLGRAAQAAGETTEARAAYLAAVRFGYPPERVGPRLEALGQGR